MWPGAAYLTSLSVSFLINITNVVELILVKGTLQWEDPMIPSHRIGNVYKHLCNVQEVLVMPKFPGLDSMY